MRICTTPGGVTYTGYSDLMTTEEWTQWTDALFANKPTPRFAERRAKALGGRRYTGKRYGDGYTFPGKSTIELREEVQQKFPELIKA